MQNLKLKIKTFLDKNPNGVIEILGCTASGKTDFSIKLVKWIAKEMNKTGEIISVDSRQVYKECDVSSAKIITEEMQGIKHYGLNLIDLTVDYSVFDFQKFAFKTIEQIFSSKKLPILCGGTMMWLDSVSENYDFPKDKNEKSNKKNPPKFPVLKIGIHWDRKILYERINQRAVIQFDNGLIAETEKILGKYGDKISKSAWTSFGYQEIAEFLQGKISREMALQNNQKRNRNYAKKQLTWWRGRKDIIWIDGENCINF